MKHSKRPPWTSYHWVICGPTPSGHRPKSWRSAAGVRQDYQLSTKENGTTGSLSRSLQIGPPQWWFFKFGAVGDVGEAGQAVTENTAKMVIQDSVQGNGRHWRPVAASAIARQQTYRWSVRARADFLLGRVQFVGMSARQVRACTQHSRHRDASQVGLDNSCNVRMRNTAICTALGPHTYRSRC